MDRWESVVVADEAIAMSQVLDLFGISYQGIPGQVRCPVHKLGQETSPSARLYEDNKYVFCFTCNKQYSVSQVAEAQWGIKRSDAAERLLGKFPVPGARVQEILKEASKPKTKSLNFTLLDFLENALIAYRFRVPFEVYRAWARKLTDLQQSILTQGTAEQEQIARLFVSKMQKEFESQIKSSDGN